MDSKASVEPPNSPVMQLSLSTCHLMMFQWVCFDVHVHCHWRRLPSPCRTGKSRKTTEKLPCSPPKTLTEGQNDCLKLLTNLQVYLIHDTGANDGPFVDFVHELWQN